MRIVELTITNFRGISSLTWNPQPGLSCLVGPGDSGKTTILEAIEIALYPRWALQFVDSDFFGATTENPIEITVTLVDLPDRLTRQERFGLELRGVAADGTIHDEPEDEDAPALTIRLRVDGSLEPLWTVISDRNQDGRPIAARDRELLAAVRLGDDNDRQLAWGRGSALSRLTDDPDGITAALSAAHKKARDAIGELEFDSFGDTAEHAGEWGARYGSQLALPLRVGIDPRQLNVGSGSLNLIQANGIPARAVGLGSRRLLVMALQREAADQRLITLVDEVEHGLEPHRVRHVLRQLRESGHQVILTTHSDTAVAELGVESLAVVRRDSAGTVNVLTPDSELQRVVRSMPEAFLARKVVVCEGATEYGLSRGLVRAWDRTAPVPIAARGVVFVDGEGGDSAARRVLGLRRLGFDCALWGDSDQPTVPAEAALAAAGARCVLWADEVNTEQRLALDVADDVLAQLWDIAVSERTAAAVANQLAQTLGRERPFPNTWAEWCASTPAGELRTGFGQAAGKAHWFKTISIAEQVGELLGVSLAAIPETDLAKKIGQVEAFATGD